MCKRRKLLVSLSVLMVIFVLIYVCGNLTMAIFISDNIFHRRFRIAVQTSIMELSHTQLSDTSERDFIFDFDGNDVLIFLHVQKTGGSNFERHLVKDLILKKPCWCNMKKDPMRCWCQRPGNKESWMISRYTTGWMCGIHADWSELATCIPRKYNQLTKTDVERRFVYITFLREPISRYLSEYKHVQRGATWFKKTYGCGGKQISHKMVSRCYKGRSWNCSSLQEFLNCPHNLAHNRQTRMLSDLTLVGCYNESYLSPEERSRIMLASAKKNLESMAFFGLTEYQKLAQYYFESKFGVRFNIEFQQDTKTFSNAALETLKPDQLEKIKEMNALDLELYDFAKKLLAERMARLYASEVRHLGLNDLLESVYK